MSLILTATAAFALAVANAKCPPDVTELECRLGKRLLILKQDVENERTWRVNLQHQLANCNTAIEIAESVTPQKLLLEPTMQPIPPEDTLSKLAIAGVATGALVLGASLATIAIEGGDTGQIVALSVGGTAIIGGWLFAWLIW